MKRALILITALVALAPFAANAEPARLTDASYVAASRCLAYAELPQLQSNAGDYAALRTAVNQFSGSAAMRSTARSETRQIRAHAGTLASSEAGMNALRQFRSDSCAGFVQSGLVQSDAAPHA